MPRRKQSRVPTRAKPVVPDDSLNEPDMEAEQRKEKLKLLLADFDREVQRRKAQMEEEITNIQQSIRQIYKIDLLRYPEDTRKMLWVDYIKQQNEEVESSARNSLVSAISCADSILQSAAKKRVRRKKDIPTTVDNNGFLAPVTRSTRVSRQKAVFGNSQVDNMLPPPSTGRPQRTRKVVQDIPATPVDQNIPPSFMNSMLVTPKFDPRTPLPPGTLKRKPKVGEIAISLTGSPLQVSPLRSNYDIKHLMENLEKDGLDDDVLAELQEFHDKVGKLLNM